MLTYKDETISRIKVNGKAYKLPTRVKITAEDQEYCFRDQNESMLSLILLKLLCKEEGIIPALESSHAVAYAIKIAQNYIKAFNFSTVFCNSAFISAFVVRRCNCSIFAISFDVNEIKFPIE